MPITITYGKLTMACDTAKEASEIARLLVEGSSPSASSNGSAGEAAPDGHAIQGASAKFLNSLLHSRSGVRQDKLIQEFGYRDAHQLAGIISATKRSLRLAGIAPDAIVRSETPDGGSMYALASNCVEAVKEAVGATV